MAYIIIDFDSTFMQVEALEELGEIVLKDPKEKGKILQQIKDITNQGMEGTLSFHESLVQRMDLLHMHQRDIDRLVKRLRKKVSVSFSRNKAFFKKYKGQIYIISSGFKDFIVPVVAPFEIEADHVLANTFLFDEEGWVTGFDQDNPLAFSKGKPKVLQRLNLDGEIWVIGDGYTDYEMVEAGIAHKFFAFTENVLLRESLSDKAHHVTPSFDEFLYVNRMPRALSYPKSRISVLLEAGIPEEAEAHFRSEGYQVDILDRPIDAVVWKEKINETAILGVHPSTYLDPSWIAGGSRLMAIGVFGAALGYSHLPHASLHGVALFDAPYTHTRALAELEIAQIIYLLRGAWNWQSNSPVERQPGLELRGKTLGIIGYGNSGQQLSILAEALGMRVRYYDLMEKPALGNAQFVPNLPALLKEADVISLNLDQRPENKGFFDATALRRMQPHAIFLNFSNGEAVDLPALSHTLESGKLRGAAIDVLPAIPTAREIAAIEQLHTLPNVLLTPHLSGDTVESRQRAASFVPNRIIEYINTGSTQGSLNFPDLQLPVLRDAHRLIHIHENKAGILAQINRVLADHKINILGQYLKTNTQIGYSITDIDKKYSKKVLNDLKGIEHTIKFRVLY